MFNLVSTIPTEKLYRSIFFLIKVGNTVSKPMYLICITARRPPVEETTSFLNSLLASHGPNYLEKLFGSKARHRLRELGGVNQVAIALSGRYLWRHNLEVKKFLPFLFYVKKKIQFWWNRAEIFIALDFYSISKWYRVLWLQKLNCKFSRPWEMNRQI